MCDKLTNFHKFQELDSSFVDGKCIRFQMNYNMYDLASIMHKTIIYIVKLNVIFIRFLEI